MLEKIKNLKIKFINFKEKSKNKNEKVNMQKVKEVRTFGNCCGFSWNWVYEFFDEFEWG